MSEPEPPLDCLVIGGGAGGLTAAVYLGRYRRRALVLDAGNSRLGWIARSRNVPGFPDGIEGKDLWQRMQEHAARYGVTTRATEVTALERGADGLFTARSNDNAWRGAASGQGKRVGPAAALRRSWGALRAAQPTVFVAE